ncbi:MAG: hypothetical protein ACM3ZA_06820, partial [Bacillota bacterium]
MTEPNTSRTGLTLLASALLLGVMGDLLLRAGPPGLNALLWTATLGLLCVVLARRGVVSLSREGSWLMAA